MELKINNKIFAFKGCIGRREYILNLFIVNMFTIFLTMPFSIWMSRSLQNPLEAFNFPAIFAAAPISVMFLYSLACLICIVFHFGLVSRRIADIKACQVNAWIYAFVSLIILVPYIWMFKTNSWTGLAFLITCMISFFLMIIPGKISRQLPQDDLKRFNWGAFWGTWIWGLFNKTYVTLWTLLFMFTPASVTWMIICGIKGNEWAFKNTKALEAEKFHKGQRNQAIFWNSFAAFLIFVMPFLLTFFILAYSIKEAPKNPDMLKNVTSTISEIAEDLIVENFTDYELDIDENKFYMEPENWVYLTYNERYDLFRGAASFASLKKMQSSDEKFEGYSGSKTTEMEITKIYSAYNGEILAEFNISDVDADDVKNFKSAIKVFMKALYFNVNPQLPPDSSEE